MLLALLALASGPVLAADDAVAVAKLYEEMCMACHLPEGKAPVKEMRFANGDWKHGTKIADIAKVIREGASGTAMQPFKDQLSAKEIEALARYVRAFDKRLKPEPEGKGKK